MPLEATAHPLIFREPLAVILLLGSSKLLLDSNLFTFIVLSKVCTVPSFYVIFTDNFLLPVFIDDISINPSKPALSPLEYPGYALFTSVLVVP